MAEDNRLYPRSASSQNERGRRAADNECRRLNCCREDGASRVFLPIAGTRPKYQPPFANSSESRASGVARVLSGFFSQQHASPSSQALASGYRGSYRHAISSFPRPRTLSPISASASTTLARKAHPVRSLALSTPRRRFSSAPRFPESTMAQSTRRRIFADPNAVCKYSRITEFLSAQDTELFWEILSPKEARR